jgi:hypothetical protein
MIRILRSATVIGLMLTLNVHTPLPVLTFSNRLSEDSDIIRVSVSDRFSAQSLHLNYVFGAGQLAGAQELRGEMGLRRLFFSQEKHITV